MGIQEINMLLSLAIAALAVIATVVMAFRQEKQTDKSELREAMDKGFAELRETMDKGFAEARSERLELRETIDRKSAETRSDLQEGIRANRGSIDGIYHVLLRQKEGEITSGIPVGNE